MAQAAKQWPSGGQVNSVQLQNKRVECQEETISKFI